MNRFLILLAAFILLSCLSSNTSNSAAEKSLEELIKMQKAIVIEGKIFDDAIDFTSILEKKLIGENIFQVDVESVVTFKNCVFNQPVTAYHATDDKTVITVFHNNLSFIGCKFNSDLNLRAANIYGRLDLSKSKFFGTSSFEEMSCLQNAYFTDDYFDKDVRFQNSFFTQKINFMNTQFNETVSFQNAVFNSEAQFSVCKFYGYADFSLVEYRGHAFFNYVQFHERADLGNAHFTRDLNYSGTLNKMTTFENSRFMGKTNFSKSKVSESFNLENCLFLLGDPVLDFMDTEKVKL